MVRAERGISWFWRRRVAVLSVAVATAIAGSGLTIRASEAPPSESADASTTTTEPPTTTTAPPTTTTTAPPTTTTAPDPTLDVIVRRHPDSNLDLTSVVTGHRGRVRQQLNLIEAVAANVPTVEIPAIEATPGVIEVTEDTGVTYDKPTPSPAASGQEPIDFVEEDFGRDHPGKSFSALTLANLAEVVGADRAWREATGRGIDVALIDSGVAPVNGMGAVVNGPDLSFESQVDAARHLDTYGHGTHLAGIINGRARDVTGIAPDARLVSVKVAASNGAADVSQVIAAIDWVVQHRRDNGLNIRVLVLAFGTDSTQDHVLDPLAHAVEVAWHHGIVVVVAAGNRGVAHPSLDDPASDPYVIAVGASEPHGTYTTGDDSVAEFSSRGTDARGVDLVAPGRSVLSFRDPGSWIDQQHPEGRVGERLFRGSGTSQATAVVAGTVALMLEEHPEYTPDQVKWVLRKTAKPLPLSDRQSQGAGILDAGKAVKHNPPSSADAVQAWPRSTGTGSLEGARGNTHLEKDAVGLVGEKDIFGTPWDGVSWSSAAANGVSWSAGSWNGVSWSGVSWSGVSWSGVSWSGVSWSGVSWSGVSWSGASWNGVSWSGVSWSGVSWSGVSWSTATVG